MTQSPVAPVPSRTKCPRCRALAWQKDGDISCLSCGTIYIPTISIADAMAENAPSSGSNRTRFASHGQFTAGGSGDGCEHARTCLSCPLAECDKAEWQTRKNPEHCVLPECGQPHSAHGYCRRHAERFRRTGSPYPPAPRTAPTHCTVPGCQRVHAAKGLCGVHYHVRRRRMEKAR